MEIWFGQVSKEIAVGWGPKEMIVGLMPKEIVVAGFESVHLVFESFVAFGLVRMIAAGPCLKLLVQQQSQMSVVTVTD